MVKIYVDQTITYRHEIVIEGDECEALEKAISEIELDVSRGGSYGEIHELMHEFKDKGFKVIDYVEDGSGDASVEFEY